jgi:hypothetical protein
MDGPVVKTAQAALEKGTVTPVLKWVKPPQEAQVREAFQKTLAVRGLGREARDLADKYFFETLVRLHREGEGAPYAGLKPAGAVEPVVAASDKALEAGSVEELTREITQLIAEGIRHRFTETRRRSTPITTSQRAASLSRRTSNSRITWSGSTPLQPARPDTRLQPKNPASPADTSTESRPYTCLSIGWQPQDLGL